LLDAQAERALALAMTGDLAAAHREIDAVIEAQPADAVKFEYTQLGLHPDPMQADARAALQSR
jgi:hypothetical protein